MNNHSNHHNDDANSQALAPKPVFNTDNVTQTLLQCWFETGQIRAIDKQFGWFLQQLNPLTENLADTTQIDWIAIIGVVVSQQSAQQHACVALDDIALLIQRLNRQMQSVLNGKNNRHRHSTLPLDPAYLPLNGQQLLAVIQTEVANYSPRITCVAIDDPHAGQGVANTPLILETSQQIAQPRLFLHKYWCYETRLVTRLLHFARSNLSIKGDSTKRDSHSAGQAELTADLNVLFPPQAGSHEINWQKVAVALAAQQKLTVITGGPGTGKTTTVAKLLWLLAKQASGNDSELVIKLAAPTGKAAARLSESLRSATTGLAQLGHASAMPLDCTTIHRLLGVKKLSPFFVHHGNNPLSLDVLVVDEASMIDLPLLCKLFEALPNHAQVILLGDNNQLASVEVGSVLGDVCVDKQGVNLGAVFSHAITQTLQNVTSEKLADFSYHRGAEALPRLTDNIVHLQKSYRFDAQSGIGFLARAVNAGDVSNTMNLLRHRKNAADAHTFEDISWHGNLQQEELLALIHKHWQGYFAAAKQADVEKVFYLLTQLQILCTQRQGEWGVEGLNASLELYFSRCGWIEQRTGFYAGKPVMITENDHRLGLYNGDIGVVLPAALEPDSLSPNTLVSGSGLTDHSTTASASLMRVWFPASNQSSETSKFQYFLTGQLPRHETVYAMTTHKSQGSEFAHVVLCMPEPRSEQQKTLLNRELFYTGITRARKKVSVFANPGAVSHAVSQQCERASGLMERLL